MEVIFKDVSFSYSNDNVYALKDINLELKSEKIHGIIGPIGSGKTTMLELMNGLTKPTKGKIKIGKYNLCDKKYKFNDFRYNVGLVYQCPEKYFFCNTVGEEVAFSQKIFDKKHKNLKEKVIKSLKMVGLNESYINRNPYTLNGGEKRRVAIASVLISNPKLLILDEPTIGLDANSKKRLMNLLKRLKDEYSKTIIIVTHDVDMLFEIVDDVVVLNNGNLVTFGNKLDVFSNVDILKENNTPIPSIINFEKIIFDKYGIDLGYCKNMNELIRTINNCIRGDLYE